MKSMYAALMDEKVLPINQPLWKLKIPLKIKVFIWLLHRGVILTKDNLARRNWKGSMLCCYCSDKENIAHLFFNCSLASILWRIIHTTLGLRRPNTVNHIFGSWLRGLTKLHKKLGLHRDCSIVLGNLASSKKLKTKHPCRSFPGPLILQELGRFFTRRRTRRPLPLLAAC